jgi:exodeoxyribonuclease V gamma subunit
VVLHVHRSEYADRLVDGLADVLSDRPADPFAVEVIAVPAKGVERWLTQRLSHVLGTSAGRQDGVCANVQFPQPTALAADAVAAAHGLSAGDDPWGLDRLVWTLLEVIDTVGGEDWCSTLGGHLGIGDAGHPHRRGRRLAAAQHLAGLFDAYAAHRPAMLREWAVGTDTDGMGGVLDDDLRWQPELWRRLRDRVGTESPAERLAAACEQLRIHPELVDLPPRLSLFGPTRLTTAQLETLAALGWRRDVHLWLPHPSGALWDRVASRLTTEGPVRRREDPTAGVPRNPLLASLGRDARELQLQLAGCATADSDHLAPPSQAPTTLLGRLQRALHDDADERTDPPERPTLDPSDRSLQVHACHGPTRQVEVLREVLVGLLAADPTLEPRDVLVMCPDIEDYAPLISATFGLEDGDPGAHHPGHRLRVRLADRSLRQTNPVLATVATLLELADGRVTASQLLDLAAAPPVRTRFRFRDDDLERLGEWVATAGVRWGLDAEHRQRFGLGAVAQNTWRAGLDRLLLGAAMAEDDLRWVGLALPLDDVDSADIELAGRLAELVDRLSVVLADLTGEQPLADWLDTLTKALDSLTAVRDADTWQLAQARRELGRVATDAGTRGDSVPLSLADIHALLAKRLRGRPTRANFRTGNLTMCSMVPMRSVPHRVICLLGLDDGKYPRSYGLDGDDVLARDPCVGERDPRAEDRQLLLDAVLAAREHLVILYTGADPRTNFPRAPAVPVGEILDAVDATVATGDGRLAREHVVVRHPLQPFDARNFRAGALGRPGPFSFDEPARRGAERAAQPRDLPPAFLAAPLPYVEFADIALADLVSFLEQPVRAFLRQKLGVTLVRDDEELADNLPVALDSLQQWGVGDRLLRARLAGADPSRCQLAEWRRGTLPPGALGTRMVADVMRTVEPIVAASATGRQQVAREVDVVADLGGRLLTGTVGNVRGATVVRVEYSKLGPRHRLRAWAQLLALSVAHPDASWTALTIGRGSNGRVARSVLGPVERDSARARLGELADLMRRGLCAPLPMAAKTSATYAAKRAAGLTVDNALAMAEREWCPDRYPGEQAEPAHQLVWGERAPLTALLGELPWAEGRGAGWPTDEPSGFGVLARRLWEPLLAAEQRDTG